MLKLALWLAVLGSLARPGSATNHESTSPAPKNLKSPYLNHETGIIHAREAGLFYEAAGSGEVIVLLHGHSFDRRMWDPQFAELAKHFRVIRYDLRGYGQSDLPLEGRDFSHAQDLLAVLDQLHVAKAHVGGLSLGAYVTADFLALHPDRLASATLASGGIYDSTGEPLSGETLSARRVEIEKLRREGIEPFKARWRESLLEGCGPRAESVRPLLTAMIADWSAWQPLHIEPPHLLGVKQLPRLRETAPRCPVLFLSGANDIYARQAAAEYATVLPQLKTRTLLDAGHLCSLEQPVAFTRTLLDFISSCTPPGNMNP